MNEGPGTFLGRSGDWETRLAIIVATMRDLSGQTDPEQMVQAYSERMQQIRSRDRMVSLSRRGHQYPEYRITRDSARKVHINPWTQRDRLPVLRGGLLGELIYGDEPRIIDDLDVADDDPGADYLVGQRSLMAIPLFDQGVATNMVLFLRKDRAAFDREELPENVWISNLFGRATHNLVLSDELKRAYQAVDNELKAVAAIQRSLLPARLPEIPTTDWAVHYQTSTRAGGDYYDFFPLTGGTWGVLIADVSGHGTPAAVLMAVTHAIAHLHPEAQTSPAELLGGLNRQLGRYYIGRWSAFVTAFYGVYDPAARQLTYASAGHPPPRLKHCDDGSLTTLAGTRGLPLGIEVDERYTECTQTLRVGDQLLFYTDGITEAFNPAGEVFGTQRLDQVLTNCRVSATSLINAVLEAVADFGAGRPADDDRTLLVAKIT
ncbi:MAG: serine/threonine-protein phosphatase [bacterium]|nr:serine/threonine-protein phosphatase [bacterium]